MFKPVSAQPKHYKRKYRPGKGGYLRIAYIAGFAKPPYIKIAGTPGAA